MKTIPKPDIKDAKVLTPLEMNAIHFGGNHTPLTPEQLAALANSSAKAVSAVGK